MDTACPPPQPAAAVRARLWLAAADLGTHDDDARLWLHLADRRVLAFRLPAAQSGNDNLIPALTNAVAADLRGTLLEIDLGGRGTAYPLYAAPAAPMPLCAYGHPVHAAARAFAAGLDQAVLQLLASLDAHRYWSSVRNYNRLAALPGEAGTRRMQAVARFPLLAAPIVLTAHHFPNLEGGKRHAWRNHDPAVIDAIERGRDLTGALATHYRISKGLVRAPVCRDMWGDTGIAHTRLLGWIDGIPAHRRPTHWREIVRVVAYLPALDRLAAGDDAAPLVAAAFRSGWTSVWDQCEARFAPLAHALDDARDFLQAALDDANARLPEPLSVHALTRAWLETCGLVSLLTASRRWHLHPQLPVIDGALAPWYLPALLGTLSGTAYRAHELVCFNDLSREGSDMRHCVASYWEDCVKAGTRIFALTLAGERATAEYACTDRGAADLAYRLAQLRGPSNARPGAAITRFARALERVLNHPARRAARTAIRRHLEPVTHEPPAAAPRLPLDPESQRQLTRVLARLPAPPVTPGEILRTPVAGYDYHGGHAVEHRLAAHAPLDLVREPDNLHDPLAVRVDWQGIKLGYLPRAVNAGIARRLDTGEKLACRIQRIDRTADSWQRLHIVVADQVLIG